MDDIQSFDPFQQKDAQYWEKAVEIYNQGLKNGALNEKYIHTGQSQAGHKTQITAQDLMTTSLNSYKRLNKKKGLIAGFLIRIYQTIHRHGKAIDVFIQYDPFIASLIWGSMRVLLQIIEDDDRASQIASEGILEIFHHVGRWEQVSEISQLLNSPNLATALTALYVRILDFLVTSKHWAQKSLMQRFGASALSSKANKLEDKLKKYKAASETVDKEVQTRATCKTLDYFRELSFDLRGTMDKIDSVLQQVQQLSDWSMATNNEELRNNTMRTDYVVNSQLSGLLDSQKANTSMVEHVITELESLPISIANKIFDRMEVMNGLAGLADIKKWLTLGVSGASCPGPRAEGTCEWVFRHPCFQELMGSDDKTNIWILGLPGRGKTVMARYIQDLLSRQNHKVLFYQFQRSASTLHSTPTTFTCSLVFQILSDNKIALQVQGCLEQLQALSVQFPLGPTHCPFQTIWNIASSLLVSSGREYKLVIDAMDECMFESPSQPAWHPFLSCLSGVMRKTQSKLFIFSRPEPKFKSAIESGLSIFMSVDLLLPDMMKFAFAMYDEFLLPESKKDVVLERVREYSLGSFRWTWLFLDYLRHSLRSEDFDIRLHKLPPSLGDLYRNALLDSFKQLDRDELNCQRSIFLMSFQAQRTLKVSEIGDALLLLPEKIEDIISNLCKPFLTTEEGFLQLIHPSVREFFESYDQIKDDCSPCISFQSADSVLAEKCLAALLNTRYTDLKLIGSYMKANYNEQPIENDKSPPKGSFYNYASRYWDHHLARTKSPSETLIRQLKDFIFGVQFAFWAEYSLHDSGQLVCVTRAFTRIRTWIDQLSDADKSYINIENYFTHPYQHLSLAFARHGEEEALQWLALISLGRYSFTAGTCHDTTVGNSHEATVALEEASVGLSSVLGPEDPMLLRARTFISFVRLVAGKASTARDIYSEVVTIQQRVLGEDNVSFVRTLLSRGESEYHMSDFPTALVTLTQVLVMFLRLTGPDSWQYLATQWWHAKSLAQMGQFHVALKAMRLVSQKRRYQFGADDTFALVVQRGIGEVLRLLGNHDESISILEVVVEDRRRNFALSNLFRLDTEIALAISYFSGGKSQKAMAILEEIERNVSLVGVDLLQRAFQVSHLKALLLAEDFSVNQAIDLLQGIIIQIDQDQNTRALLWIRLDLADLLRGRCDEGDSDQASANFDKIVCDISGEPESGFPDEPDTPRLLAVAERALRLVRDRKHDEAHRELEMEKVDWMRPSDFWLFAVGSDFSV